MQVLATEIAQKRPGAATFVQKLRVFDDELDFLLMSIQCETQIAAPRSIRCEGGTGTFARQRQQLSFVLPDLLAELLPFAEHLLYMEIGRASCRERV